MRLKEPNGSTGTSGGWQQAGLGVPMLQGIHSPAFFGQRRDCSGSLAWSFSSLQPFTACLSQGCEVRYFVHQHAGFTSLATAEAVDQANSGEDAQRNGAFVPKCDEGQGATCAKRA